jgi:hypothetical protein
MVNLERKSILKRMKKNNLLGRRNYLFLTNLEYSLLTLFIINLNHVYSFELKTKLFSYFQLNLKVLWRAFLFRPLLGQINMFPWKRLVLY